MGVLAFAMSELGRTGGGGVLAWHAGLLMDTGTGAGEPSKPGVVLPPGASALGCMTEVSASLTDHTGPALGLTVAERNQERSLIESA